MIDGAGAPTKLQASDRCAAIPVADHVYDYVLATLARDARASDEGPLSFVREWVTWGAGPRASQFLVLGAKAHAALAGPQPRLGRGRARRRAPGAAPPHRHQLLRGIAEA